MVDKGVVLPGLIYTASVFVCLLLANSTLTPSTQKKRNKKRRSNSITENHIDQNHQKRRLTPFEQFSLCHPTPQIRNNGKIEGQDNSVSPFKQGVWLSSNPPLVHDNHVYPPPKNIIEKIPQANILSPLSNLLSKDCCSGRVLFGALKRVAWVLFSFGWCWRRGPCSLDDF